MPLVSVILPVFNAERYLASAVQSVLDQTFKDFELIVVNDGSTDGSLQILQDFAARDGRVRLISRPNTGYVVALNEAIALSEGEFLARMDADDLCLPQRFEKQVAFLQSHPDHVLVGTHVAQMDSDGAVIGPMNDIDFGHDTIDHALLRRGWPIVHPSIMMRTSTVREIGGYLPELCPNEDHDLFIKLAEKGKLENLPDVLLHYRKHPASESTIKQDKSAHLVPQIIIDACRRRGVSVPAEVVAPQKPVPKQSETERVWAWAAVKSKNIHTARKYALATLRRRPLSLDSWRLTYCAVRGH